VGGEIHPDRRLADAALHIDQRNDRGLGHGDTLAVHGPQGEDAVADRGWKITKFEEYRQSALLRNGNLKFRETRRFSPTPSPALEGFRDEILHVGHS
jgi:hypothetical protein